jgi:multidrug transporter EmrE-like cation transporter
MRRLRGDSHTPVSNRCALRQDRHELAACQSLGCDSDSDFDHCLWRKIKRQESDCNHRYAGLDYPPLAGPAQTPRGTRMNWLRLMLGAMVANGFGMLGAKMLAETGLGSRFQDQYLLGWYTTGFVVAVLFTLRKLALPWRKEVMIGGGMALMSFLGQTCLVLALSGGAPGYLVYPIANGANVLFVAVAGVLIFREKLGITGMAGILCGLIAVVILSLP